MNDPTLLELEDVGPEYGDVAPVVLLSSPAVDYRATWGALPPKGNPGPFTGLEGTVLHYTGAGRGYMVPASSSHDRCREQWRAIQRQHQADPTQSDISYNAGACSHGVLLEGRVLGYKGGANGTAAANASRPSVCALVGVGDVPTDALLAAVAWFHAQVEGKAGRRLTMDPHSAFYATGCPGDWLHGWLARDGYRTPGATPTPPPTPGVPPTEDDVAYPVPDVFQLSSPTPGLELPTGAVCIADPDHQTFRWIKDEAELELLKVTFARRGWPFPNPLPAIPGEWTTQYGVLIGPTP